MFTVSDLKCSQFDLPAAEDVRLVRLEHLPHQALRHLGGVLLDPALQVKNQGSGVMNKNNHST